LSGCIPGQTRPDSLVPLGRYHHRLKTHAGWSYQQTSPAVFYWRSPHGHWVRVDRYGSHYLGKQTPPATRGPEPADTEHDPPDTAPAAESPGELQLHELLAGR
jgi:hypothetical protein